MKKPGLLTDRRSKNPGHKPPNDPSLCRGFFALAFALLVHGNGHEVSEPAGLGDNSLTQNSRFDRASAQKIV